jgi:hypothetical protein
MDEVGSNSVSTTPCNNRRLRSESLSSSSSLDRHAGIAAWACLALAQPLFFFYSDRPWPLTGTEGDENEPEPSVSTGVSKVGTR